ncbi:MAG: hypothetical protein M3299_06650 [Thermoproteota archaeon]|nr:hypothetical protein [Thermoproteota archaeon]
MSKADNDEEADNAEKTEMLYGYDEIMGRVLHFFAHLDKTLDICSEPLAASYVVASNEVLMNAIHDFVNRGGKFRVVVQEITKDNIAACKEIMKVADVRHLDGIMNTFSLTPDYYFGHVTQQRSGELSQAIYSNTRKFWNFSIIYLRHYGKRQFPPGRE